jgi:hypothetical protein
MSLGALAFAALVEMAHTAFPERSSGWSAETAVRELNAMYTAFNASNDSTALGVTIGWAGNPRSFDDNLFCNGYVNTSCFNGNNDCRMSAAIMNHKVQVSPLDTGYKVEPLMARAIGYVFNQTLTENYFGKCVFLYDGATALNVNQGCGASAPVPASCDNPNSAYYNMCTSDGGKSYHHCNATDPEIEAKKCKCESCSPTYGTMTPPQYRYTQEQCFYEMPALIVPHDSPNSFTPSSTNHLRDAMKQRVLGDESSGQTQEWTEVVIDDRLLIPQIERDPTHTIVAFVYAIGASMGPEDGLAFATKMRDQYQQKYGVHGVGDIPVLELDAIHDFTQSGGPFMLPGSVGPPGPSPTPPGPPAPAPEDGSCCWGGDSCHEAQNCHGDEYCGASAEACIGSCGGVWCAHAFV